jgi:hypothetical protein
VSGISSARSRTSLLLFVRKQKKRKKETADFGSSSCAITQGGEGVGGGEGKESGVDSLREEDSIISLPIPLPTHTHTTEEQTRTFPQKEHEGSHALNETHGLNPGRGSTTQRKIKGGLGGLIISLLLPPTPSRERERERRRKKK